jgi:hypothetical protein
MFRLRIIKRRNATISKIAKLKGDTKMGRDNHNNKTGGNNTRSLPQTPKNQKIKPSAMHEEIAKEFAELRKARKSNQVRKP